MISINNASILPLVAGWNLFFRVVIAIVVLLGAVTGCFQSTTQTPTPAVISVARLSVSSSKIQVNETVTVTVVVTN